MAGLRHFDFTESMTFDERRAFVAKMTPAERAQVEQDSEDSPGQFVWYCAAAGYPMPPKARRSPIPWPTKRLLAQRYGCQPGSVLDVPCPRCHRKGEIHWYHKVPWFIGLHIDHIKPVSKGGGNESENLRLLCPRCNISRGNREDA